MSLLPIHCYLPVPLCGIIFLLYYIFRFSRSNCPVMQRDITLPNQTWNPHWCTSWLLSLSFTHTLKALLGVLSVPYGSLKLATYLAPQSSFFYLKWANIARSQFRSVNYLLCKRSFPFLLSHTGTLLFWPFFLFGRAVLLSNSPHQQHNACCLFKSMASFQQNKFSNFCLAN